MEDFEKRHILGLPEMDEQHHYLYSLFDSIEQNTIVTDKPRLKLLLEEIERYILFHFASEEFLMKAYQFPGFAVHQSDHENAGSKLIQFLDDFEAGRLNPAALRIFLTGWLMEHSRLSDSGYVAWVLEQRNSVHK